MSFWDGTRWVHADDLDRATALPSGAGPRQARATLASRAGGWGATAAMLLVLTALVVPFTASTRSTPSGLEPLARHRRRRQPVIVTGSTFPADAISSSPGTATKGCRRPSSPGTRFQTPPDDPLGLEGRKHDLRVQVRARPGRNVCAPTLGAWIASSVHGRSGNRRPGSAARRPTATPTRRHADPRPTAPTPDRPPRRRGSDGDPTPIRQPRRRQLRPRPRQDAGTDATPAHRDADSAPARPRPPPRQPPALGA